MECNFIWPMPDPVFSGVESGGISKHSNVGLNVKLEDFCNLNDGIGFTNRAFYSIIAANINKVNSY